MQTELSPRTPTIGVEAETFRRALARCAAGVVVVTVADGPTGFTASSFTSVSLHPPLVCFNVDAASSSWPRLRDSDVFAVNVLSEHQADVAARFAQRGVDRFAPPMTWQPDPSGLPLLDAAAAHLICRQYTTLPLGDHMLVVGLLVQVHHGGSDAPLLYHQGKYGRFSPAG